MTDLLNAFGVPTFIRWPKLCHSGHTENKSATASPRRLHGLREALPYPYLVSGRPGEAI
jgi:hypothetical protein